MRRVCHINVIFATELKKPFLHARGSLKLTCFPFCFGPQFQTLHWADRQHSSQEDTRVSGLGWQRAGTAAPRTERLEVDGVRPHSGAAHLPRGQSAGLADSRCSESQHSLGTLDAPGTVLRTPRESARRLLATPLSGDAAVIPFYKKKKKK